MRRIMFFGFVFTLLFSLSAFAQVLTIDNVQGQDSIRAVSRSTDTVRFSVTASIPSDSSITANQVRLKVGGNEFVFDGCTKNSGSSAHTCTYDYRVINAGGPQNLEVLLYSDTASQGVLKRERLTLFVDNKGPDVQLLTVSPEATVDGQVSLSYKVAEPSCDGSGVGLIELFEGDSATGLVIAQKTPDAQNNKGPCEFQETISYTLKREGSGQICARSKDRMGTTGQGDCVSVFFDKTAPVVLTNTLLIGEENNPVRFVSGTGQLVSVSVEIRGESRGQTTDIDQSSVRGDFSKLAGQAGFENVVPQLLPTATGVLAVWRNIPLRSVSPCSFIVKGKDTTAAGNAFSTTVSCAVASDTTAPVLDEVTTNLPQRTGKVLFAKQGLLQVFFKEDGSGMRVEDVTLAFGKSRTVGYAVPRRSSSSDLACERISGRVRCLFDYTITETTDNVDFDLVVNARDIVGNPLAIQEIASVADGKSPVINSGGVSVVKTDSSGDVIVDLGQGHNVEFTVTVAGATDAFANLTPIGGGMVAGECTSNDDGSSTCVFRGQVTRSGSFNALIEFTFTDDAGNVIRETQRIDVLGTLTDEHPNFWRFDGLDCSPSSIDRSTALLGPSKEIFCRVKLVAPPVTQGAVELVGIGIDSSVCFPNPAGFVSNIELLNKRPKVSANPTPIIKITLDAQNPFQIDRLDFTCPVSLLSRVGNKLTANTEQENVSINLTFFNDDIVTADERVERKLEKAIDAAQAADSFAETLNTFTQFGGKVCNIRSTLWTTFSAIDTIIYSVAALGDATIAMDCVGLDGVFSAMCRKQGVFQSLLTGTDECRAKFDESFVKRANENRAARADGTPPLDAPSNTGAYSGQYALFAKGTSFFSGDTCGLDMVLKPFCDIMNCQLGPIDAISGLADSDTADTVTQVWKEDVGSLGMHTLRGKIAEQDTIGTNIVNKIWDAQSLTSDVPSKRNPTEIPPGQVNAKDNFVLSVVNLCIPGMATNWDKYRQIQCRYAVCIAQDVKEDGIPISVCKDEQQYQMCNYFFKGGLFSMLPIVPFINYVTNFAKDLIAQPTIAISSLAGAFCHDFCDVPCGAMHTYAYCAAPEVANMVLDVYSSYNSIAENKEGFFDIGNGWCDQVDDIEEELEERKKEREERLVGGSS